MNPEPLILSFKLAITVTTILIPLSLFFGWLIVRGPRKLSAILEPILTLPLVLPPTVIGFYILLLFSPRLPFGTFLTNRLGLGLAFSFPGIVIASCIHSIPFMLQPLKNGFESLDKEMVGMSRVFGNTPVQTFFKIEVPAMFPFLLTGSAMSLAHTLGEFGVVMMVGGSIPGLTKVASIAIYENVELLNLKGANTYAIPLIIACTAAVILARRFGRIKTGAAI